MNLREIPRSALLHAIVCSCLYIKRMGHGVDGWMVEQSGTDSRMRGFMLNNESLTTLDS